MPRTPEATPTREAIGLATQSALTQITTSSRPSSFDAHNPPEPALMDKCVHCGFCLPACPTYALWGEEMDSPRGRIWLMRKAATGEAPLDDIFQTHIDRCLGCMACMTACPSGVEYNKLIEDTRGQVERQAERTGSRSLSDRLFRKLLFATFPHPRRLRALGLPLAIYQRSGLQKLVRGSGLLKLLPERLRSMEACSHPSRSIRSTRSRTPSAPANKSRGRVAMLTGCVQDAFFAPRQRRHRARPRRRRLRSHHPQTARLLRRTHGPLRSRRRRPKLREGHDRHLRRRERRHDRHQRRRLRQHHEGVRTPPPQQSRLVRARRCLLRKVQRHQRGPLCRRTLGFIAPRRPIPLRVAYHDACHLRHAQGIFAAAARSSRADPRAHRRRDRRSPISAAVPPASTTCCNPETANELGDRKVSHLLATGADAVISANPGCLLQLMNGLRRRGAAELPTFHMVELLDASIRGLTVDQLLHGPRSLDVELNSLARNWRQP